MLIIQTRKWVEKKNDIKRVHGKEKQKEKENHRDGELEGKLNWKYEKMPSSEREKIEKREIECVQHYTSKAKKGKRKEEKREKTRESMAEKN